MVSTSLVFLAGLALIRPMAHASKKFVARLPNGDNVEGYQAIGHSDGTGDSEATNAFGKAFEKAGNKWTVALCQADTDGDGQTNGQELGDPCCAWSTGATPQWTSGVSHPSLSDKKSDPTLWANVNCSAVTTIPTTDSSGADSTQAVQSAASMFAFATGIALLFA
ncbi:hypothetical protein PRNP1_014183 [Phytophthora ramorum]